MLAGLHFAGETGANTDEHALACLLESVLEKLEITLLPPTQKLSPRPPTTAMPPFPRHTLDPPALDAALKEDAVLMEGSEIIPYTHSRTLCSPTSKWMT